MKIRTRIITAITTAIASVFVAAPALAHEPHLGESQYSVAGSPLDIVAISIVMVILLVVVLGGSVLIGKLFDAKKN